MPAVCVGRIGAKRGHLHLPGVQRANNGDHAKSCPNGKCPTVAKHPPHLIGFGRSGHIVVGRHPSQEFVPHATTRKKSFKMSLAEPPDSLDCKLSGTDWVGHSCGH